MKLDLPQLNEQRLLVLGLGDSGLAMARWCVRFGAQVTVWDSRAQPPQLVAAFVAFFRAPNDWLPASMAAQSAPFVSPLQEQISAESGSGPSAGARQPPVEHGGFQSRSQRARRACYQRRRMAEREFLELNRRV